MKKLTQLALGALMLAGTAIGMSAPANARVSVGIGIGVPGPYYGPGCYGWYDPYRCAGYDPYYYDDAYYDGPLFIDGVWFNGPLRWRWWGGHRMFWWHGGWRHGTGFRPTAFHSRGWNSFARARGISTHSGGFRGPRLSTGFHGGIGRPSAGFHGGMGRPSAGFHGGVGSRPSFGGHVGGGHFGGGSHMGGGHGHR